MVFLGAMALLFAVIYGLTALLDQFMSLRVADWLPPLSLVAVTPGQRRVCGWEYVTRLRVRQLAH